MGTFSMVGKHFMQLKSFFLCLGLAITLTHCSTYDFSRRIVEQGNLLPQNKIERLHIGMSKQDAAILMGTSLLSPLFNNNRWDYVYTLKKGGNAMDIRRLSLYFRGNSLIKIDRNGN